MVPHGGQRRISEGGLLSVRSISAACQSELQPHAQTAPDIWCFPERNVGSVTWQLLVPLLID